MHLVCCDQTERSGSALMGKYKKNPKRVRDFGVARLVLRECELAVAEDPVAPCTPPASPHQGRDTS